MNRVKRRSKKNCLHFDQGNSKIGYCIHPKLSGLFCGGICQFYKARTRRCEG